MGLMVLGATLMLLAAIGVVRMPDLYSRMQSATKASSLGAGCLLLAVAVHFADPAITTRVLMIIVFILMTAPVSAHMIGRAAYFVGVPLWEGTTIDELRGRYDPRTHALESGLEHPPSDGQPTDLAPS
jgi:multicomponent Na+:H+ antiporter subunit G